MDEGVANEDDDVDVPVRVVEDAEGELPVEEVELHPRVVQDKHRHEPRAHVVQELPHLGVLAEKHRVGADPLPPDCKIITVFKGIPNTF